MDDYFTALKKIQYHVRRFVEPRIQSSGPLSFSEKEIFVKTFDGTVIDNDRQFTDWVLNKIKQNTFSSWPSDKSDAIIKPPEKAMENNLNGLQSQKVRRQKERANRDDKKSKYYEYLLTDEWRKIIQLVKDRDGNRCVKCGSTQTLQVHHTTYSHVFNEMEHLGDLVTLCKRCHKRQHKKNPCNHKRYKLEGHIENSNCLL